GFVLGDTVTVVGHDDEGDSTSATDSASITYTDVTPKIGRATCRERTTISEGGVGSQSKTYSFLSTNTSATSTDAVTIDSITDSVAGTVSFALITLAPADVTMVSMEVTGAVHHAGFVLGDTVTVVGHDDEGDSTSATDSASITYTDVTP